MATSATTPKRQSCDRCHGQKLRCDRLGPSSTESCKRCLRQGAQCVYSFSLPKGRPSMYRTASNSSPMPESRAAMPPPASQPTIDASTASPVPEVIEFGDEPSYQTNPPNFVGDSTPITPFSRPNPLWSHIEPFNGVDMQLDGAEHDLSLFFNLETLTDKTHLDIDAAGHEPSHFTPTRSSTSNSDIGVYSDSSSSSHGLHESINLGPDSSISQLSQLSARLYSLHRTSSSLAETLASSSKQSRHRGQAQLAVLIDDGVFQLVATWLVRASANLNPSFSAERSRPMTDTPNIGDVLLDVFSTSSQLLEILNGLQVEPGYWPSEPTSSVPSTSHSYRSTSLTEQPKDHESGYARPSSHYYDTVICHLVVACHTQLLSIYVAVLTVLQSDVILPSSSTPTSVDVNFRADVGMTDMRLVMVVQLCSYLIKRQRETVEAYLTLQNMSSAAQAIELPATPMGSGRPGTVGQDAMKELVLEVQQRIAWLRHALRI